MYIFSSIYEIVSAINKASKVLIEMFEKRRLLSFRYSDALTLLDDDENRLRMLIEKEIIHQNGMYVELDERFLDFFELLLEANEDINTATIDENIRQLHEQMDYFQKENVAARRKNYLRSVKSIFRKIAKVTVRNVITLQQNIDNTFKNEPNYQIKIAKLESLDRKRLDIQRLIHHMETLLTGGEALFFSQAMDDELADILLMLRSELQISSHHLIKAQQDIINYLNQIRTQVVLVEKIRKVKYLRDQLELRAKSNFAEVLKADHSVMLEGAIQPLFKLSLDYLASDAARDVLLKVSGQQKNGIRTRRNEAEAFSDDELVQQMVDDVFVNLDEVMAHFLASGDELFPFLLHYSFHHEVGLDERLTLFCQIASLYEPKLDIREEYGRYLHYEYAKIYPL